MKVRSISKVALTAICLATLVACGGGGGGSTPTANAPATCASGKYAPDGSCYTPPAPKVNPALKPTDVSMTCDTKYTPNLSYVDVNTNADWYYTMSEWGSSKLTGWQVCMGVGFASLTNTVGRWTWDYGNNTVIGSVGGGAVASELNYVKAYPSVVYGESLGSSMSPTFPKQVATIKNATITWDMDITHSESTGGAGRDGGNVLFDIYFSTDNNPVNTTSSTLNANLAINVVNWGSMDFWQGPFELVTIDGVEYKFHAGPNQITGNTATAVTFKSNVQQYKGTINLMSFINFMKSRGLIIDANWLDRIAIGNEISEGKGETKLNSFSVTVN